MSRLSVSVVMPAFDAERWIGEALECVLGQSIPPDELIVVDDGSRDQTAARARAAGRMIRVVHQDNRGVASATNRGFAEATGDYVAICPADDRWEPRKLEWQLEAVQRSPEIDVAFGAARYFGVEERDFPKPPGVGILDLHRLGPALYIENVIANPSALVRRALHRRLGGHREELRLIAEDYDFWLRAAEVRAVFHYDPRLLVRLRQHGDNLSSQALTTWEAQYKLHREHTAMAGDAEVARRVLAHDLATIARCRLGLGMPAEAGDAYRASFSLRPTVEAGVFAGLLALPGVTSLVARMSVGIRRSHREHKGNEA